MENNNYGWLLNYSLDDLKDLKLLITEAQIEKAEKLRYYLWDYFTENSEKEQQIQGSSSEELKYQPGEGATQIKDIEDFIKTIRSAGLATQCNEEIQHFYKCRNAIQQNSKYKIINEFIMGSFLNTLKYNFNSYDFEQIKKQFDDMYDYFNRIVNSQKIDTPAYREYLFKENLKPFLTTCYNNNKGKINYILDTIFSRKNDYKNIINNNSQYQTIRDKFFNAHSLLCHNMYILNRKSWKKLGHDNNAITQEISKRVNDMYELCYELKSQRNINTFYSQQLAPINYNQNLHNSFSNGMGGYYQIN